MQKGLIFRIFGVLFVIAGISIISNSFQGLTGFVVYQDVDLKAGYFLGIWFVLAGLMLALYKRNTQIAQNVKGNRPN